MKKMFTLAVALMITGSASFAQSAKQVPQDTKQAPSHLPSKNEVNAGARPSQVKPNDPKTASAVKSASAAKPASATKPATAKTTDTKPSEVKAK